VSRQDGDGRSVLANARLLIALRRSSRALREGSFRPLAISAPLLGFERIGGKTTLRCLFNLSERRLDCDLIGQGEIVYSCGDLERGQGKMGPLSACIIEVNEP